ncbi:hypothetical protein Q9966_015556 [Columba livia]|nr:hypothetical protein Q9966_015556 [Columba livia]
MIQAEQLVCAQCKSKMGNMCVARGCDGGWDFSATCSAEHPFAEHPSAAKPSWVPPCKHLEIALWGANWGTTLNSATAFGQENPFSPGPAPGLGFAKGGLGLSLAGRPEPHLSTRPCKCSQQYQEVDLDKIICRLRVDPEDLAASSSMGLREMSGTGHRVLGENKLSTDTKLWISIKRTKYKTPKL